MIRFWARISCPHHTLRCWFYSAVFIGLSVQRGELEHLRKRVMSQRGIQPTKPQTRAVFVASRCNERGPESKDELSRYDVGNPK